MPMFEHKSTIKLETFYGDQPSIRQPHTSSTAMQQNDEHNNSHLTLNMSQPAQIPEDIVRERLEQNKEPNTDFLKENNGIALARKAGIAVLGGSVVGLGVIMVPLPGPGIVVMAAGMVILGKEFPEAQRMLDVSRDKLVEVTSENGPRPDFLHDDAKHAEVVDPSETKETSMSQDDVQDYSREQKGINNYPVAFKKHALRLGRNVLPLLDRVCRSRSDDDIVNSKQLNTE